MAAAAPSVTPIGSTAPVLKGDPIVRLAQGILPILAVIIGVIAVLYVIYNGYRYMTAGGDTKKTAEARAGLINGIVGVMIIALAYTIITISISIGNRIHNTVQSPSKSAMIATPMTHTV